MEKRETQTDPNQTVQNSPGVSKETLTDKYTTHREDIAEIEMSSIQPCPIIPDYKTPTLSTQPIVVRTPEACFCIDGWHYIEQAKADGQSTIRSHIFEISDHSDTELAIRKAAIRTMPQGGKCSYAEQVRNTSRLYRALQGTSDDLVLFTHGGARRGVEFTDSKDNNIRTVLATRLGKSQTTINKYLQHGEFLNEAALEELVKSGAPKVFFEAIQANKQTVIAAQKAEQKEPAVIEEATSREVMQWLAESLAPDPPSANVPGHTLPSETERSISREQPTPSGSRGPAPAQRRQQQDQDSPQGPTSDALPTGEEDLQAELKGIGEALIEIADSKEIDTPKQIEAIRIFILELSTLLVRLANPSNPKGDGVGGTV